MNYLQLYEALTGLLPKRIKITLINDATDQEIGVYKIDAATLPDSFNKPLIIELDGERWRVMQAEPKAAVDFLFRRKLTLKVQQENLLRNLMPFQVPTIAADLPPVTASRKAPDLSHIPAAPASLSDMHAFILEDDDWRQVELAPADYLSIVTGELHVVQQLLTDMPDALKGYKRQYTRSARLERTLELPWTTFLAQLENPVMNSLYVKQHGWVENGFAIVSAHHTYYGIIENELIRVLCLSAMDAMDDELMSLMESFKLLLVDWRGAYCFGGTSIEQNEPYNEDPR